MANSVRMKIIHIAMARKISMRPTNNRRSNASAKTPAGMDNSNHGNRFDAKTSDISIGSDVINVASHGNAINIKPSAKFEQTLAPKRRRKFVFSVNKLFFIKSIRVSYPPIIIYFGSDCNWPTISSMTRCHNSGGCEPGTAC